MASGFGLPARCWKGAPRNNDVQHTTICRRILGLLGLTIYFKVAEPVLGIKVIGLARIGIADTKLFGSVCYSTHLCVGFHNICRMAGELKLVA